MTPKQSGIPYLITDGGQSYRIGGYGYVLEGHTWTHVQQEGNKFFFLKGHVLVDLDHDLIVFLYPYHRAQVTTSVRDEFAKKRDRLPRWTRTRWLGTFTEDCLSMLAYDHRAGRYVSPTCRGIKEISRLVTRGGCKFIGTEEARRQAGAED